MGRRPYVLVDRDGTLLQDSGFMHRIAEYAPLPGAIEGLRLLQETGFGIALITNQSGIGRGYFSEEDFERFQAHFIGRISQVFYQTANSTLITDLSKHTNPTCPSMRVLVSEELV